MSTGDGIIYGPGPGGALDEHEPRKAFPPDADPTLPGWSIHVPAMTVPREMRDTTAPAKRGLAGDSATRKNAPIYEGVMCYFPNALAEVAYVSKLGNDKHNPGQSLHWAFGKSTDHGDCVARHQLEAEDVDASDGGDVLHAAKVAWRALAQLETLLLRNHPELKPGKNVKGFVR